MRKRNRAAILFIVLMTAALLLAGCKSEPSGKKDDGNSTYEPGIHEAYGVSYAVPDTDWIYMFNAEQLGSGDEFIDMEISGGKAEKGLEEVWKSARTKDNSGSETIDGRECYWYDINDGDMWSKTLLIPQSDENKYIKINSEFIEAEDKEKADAFYEDILKGIEFTDDKGCKAGSDYITVGGVRIPSAGMKPVQFFYGLMDLDATDGLASVQIDFNEENYEKGPEKTFSELDWIETQTLLDNGTIEIDGTKGVWYTWIDDIPDALPYISHVILLPNDETQTLMQIDYDFDGTVDDKSRYDDRMKEFDAQISVLKAD